MTPIRCALRLGEFFIAADPTAPAPYPGWMAVAWGVDVDRHEPAAEFEITAPTQTAKLMVKNVSTGMLLNTDLTKFSGNLATALALKPTAGGTDGWDAYEQWNGWSLDGGIITVVVEYYRDGERYPGLILGVVPK